VVLRACIAATLLIAGGVIWLCSASVPPDFITPIRPSAEFFDRHGVPLRALLVDETLITRPLTADQLPPHVIAAVLAAEDKRFYQHAGIDIRASLRALAQAVQHGEFRSGASTISQQVIKLIRPGKRTLGQKLNEIRLAIAIERNWGKQRILTEYLNRLEFGDLQQGIESAARYYFAKPAAALSVAEAAFLAALPNAPTRLNPYDNPTGARARQQYILNRMLAEESISPTQHALACEENLVLAPRGHVYQAPHFVDLLLTRSQLLPVSGGEIRTTLDLELTNIATRMLASQLAALRDKNVGNGALVVVHNPTGDILAMAVAGAPHDDATGQVNCAWMPRSAGSAIKPFAYILAMESGAFPGTTVADVATSFATPTGVYRPNNYNRRFFGPVSLRFALGNSLNIAAIRTLEMAGGPDQLLRLLRNLDISTLGHPAEHYGLGLTLGNGETRLTELASAYATIARLGVHRPMRLLRDGVSSETSGRRVFAASSAWLVADMLSDNAARASAFGLNSFLALPFPAATKTGTSSDYRDNVSVGFTPEFTVAVWVGNADGSPMREITGVTGAAPVMHEMLCHLNNTFGTSSFRRPNDVQDVWIHPLLGKQVEEGSPSAVSEVCVLPPAYATANELQPDGGVRLSSNYAEWLASPHNMLGSLVSSEVRSGKLAILSPDRGTIFYLDPDLPRERQRAAFRSNGARSVRWHCETLQPGADGEGFVLKAGRHHITAEDPETKQSASTWIEVREL